jgi:Rieske Fe-S protein
MEATTEPTTTTPEPPPGRRSFFRWVTVGLGGLAAVVAGWPLVGFILGRKRPPEYWVPLGQVDDFEPDTTRLVTFDNPIRQPWDGMVARAGVFVRRQTTDDTEPAKFLILAVNCAHLGCPVEWFPQSGLFMCPCHGGVYYATGERASGPPPRGLFACDWRERNGMLEVRAPHYPTLQNTEKEPA